MFYVYTHTRNDSHEVFYVGKGKGRRAYHKGDRGARWGNIALKYGYTVEIVAYFDREDDAFEYEIETIYRLRNQGCPLINIAIGGEGASGHIHSDETKARRAAALNRPDVRKKLLEALPHGRAHHAARSVRCIETGAVFETISDAVRWLKSLGIKNASSSPISKACRGKFRRIYKHTWKFADAAENPIYIDRRLKRAIICLETDCRFPSIRDALNWLRSQGYPRASSTALSGACSGKRKHAYDFHWRYAD